MSSLLSLGSEALVSMFPRKLTNKEKDMLNGLLINIDRDNVDGIYLSAGLDLCKITPGRIFYETKELKNNSFEHYYGGRPYLEWWSYSSVSSNSLTPIAEKIYNSLTDGGSILNSLEES